LVRMLGKSIEINGPHSLSRITGVYAALKKQRNLFDSSGRDHIK
jgi:hypothetical protein